MGAYIVLLCLIVCLGALIGWGLYVTRPLTRKAEDFAEFYLDLSKVGTFSEAEAQALFVVAAQYRQECRNLGLYDAKMVE